METGIDFVGADMPNVDRFMLHVYATIFEEEGRRISERTKAALNAAKAKGEVRLAVIGHRSAQRNRKQAVDFALLVKKEMQVLALPAKATLREISTALDKAGINTNSRKCWHPEAVTGLLERFREK